MLTEIGFVDIEIGPRRRHLRRRSRGGQRPHLRGLRLRLPRPQTRAPHRRHSPCERKPRWSTAEEQEARDRFADRYREERVDVVREIEQRVIGGDWGANGYTTIAQADDLAERLRLRRGDLLLDLGAGRGWPGLYLAATTGCSVLLADLPLEGTDRRQAIASPPTGLEARAWCVNASARDLPFRAAAFDAVVHTDVLC